MYESPYQKEETEELITQVNELREALAMCWRLLPDGDYGADAVTVKRCMTKFNCWPEGAECAGFDAELATNGTQGESRTLELLGWKEHETKD